MLLKREGLRLARGTHTQLITCWPWSCPCIAITKRTSRETRKRRREIGPGITYVSCRGGEGNNMGSGIRNTAEEDAPIEIERDGGGFLFFSPLQQDTPDSPKTRYPYCMWLCCYTYESQHFTEKSPFFFLFIYFIKNLFFFLKMFFFRYSSRHDWTLSVGAENFSIWAFFLSRTYRLSQTHTKTPVTHYSVKK